MRVLQSLQQTARSRRWAPLFAAAGLLALLSGCVIYPAGGGGGWHHERFYGR